METMAGKIRDALILLSQETEIVTARDLAGKLGLTTRKAKAPMYGTLKDMKERGEILDTGKKGEYRFRPVKKNHLRTVMWRLLRSRQMMTVDDLMELAGASKEYAKEWLRMLEKRKIVKQIKTGVYKLVEDPVKEPLNTDRAEHHRALRKKKKKALAALNRAAAAIDEARKALEKS